MTQWSKTNVPVGVREIDGLFALVDSEGARVDWPLTDNPWTAMIELVDFHVQLLEAEAELEAAGFRAMGDYGLDADFDDDDVDDYLRNVG
jgi:hypothetical protein